MPPAGADQLRQASSEFDEAMSSSAEAFDTAFKEAGELVNSGADGSEVPAEQGGTVADEEAGTG